MAPRASGLTLLLVLLLLRSGAANTTATPGDACRSVAFSSNRVYAACSDLPHLSASLHWSYSAAAGALSLAFVAPPPNPEGWVSWAINPSGGGMVGSQALIGFRQADGKLGVKTYNITGYGPIAEGPIAFETSDLAAEFSGGAIRIFGKMKLPTGTTAVKQVWQVGASVADGVPQPHDGKPENLQAIGMVDLVNGETSVSAGASVPRSKIVHGVLNAVSWGIMLPIGATFARYLKTFKSADPAWFYLHVSCQIIGYGIGVSGWATGLKLGSESQGVQFTTHRNIGITVFSLGILQVFALLLRPNKDHKYRLYWNIYHHSVGYTVIILGVINVFKGLEILGVDHKWTVAYIVAICIIGAIALCLEIVTWIIVIKRKARNSTAGSGSGSRGVQQPLSA